MTVRIVSRDSYLSLYNFTGQNLFEIKLQQHIGIGCDAVGTYFIIYFYYFIKITHTHTTHERTTLIIAII